MHKGAHRIELSYQLVQGPQRGDLVVDHPLFKLLEAVERRGSISAAARGLGLSYRHVWGELKRWEDEFGHLLIVWVKGQNAQLTEFATKLLWAERYAQSRLAPQISALRADLERVFGLAFDDRAHVLAISASHDDALSALRAHAQARSSLYLDLRFGGSLDALAALAKRRATVAGFHLAAAGQLAPEIRTAMAAQLVLAAGGVAAQALHFARRQQGLIVAAGNPLGVARLTDVLDARLRFVNRPSGAGTRLFLDVWLATLGRSGTAIRGYEDEEPSHAAVAEAVRQGRADLGLGLASAAQDRGLGFIPLFDEDYWLALHPEAINDAATAVLLAQLGEADWRAQLQVMTGYSAPPTTVLRPLAEVLA